MIRKMFAFWNPISVLFEGDPANPDANNPNPTGSEPDNKPGGGGGDDPKTPKDETYELMVNGEKRSVTVDEMRELAQKAAGADAKFQEASDLRKQAEDGLRLQDLIGRLSDGDHDPSETEIRELAGMIGVDPGEFMVYMNKTDDDPPQKNDKDTPAKITPEQIAEALGMNPAEAKQILEYSHHRHIEDARKKIREMSDKGVEKDEIFGKMIIGEDKEKRMEVIKDMVAEDVLRKVQDGEPFGADLVAASTQKVRAYLTKMGIPGKPDQYPVNLGLGPGSGLPTEIQDEKPIERVKADEDDFDDNFVKRAMQKGLKLLRDQGQK